MQNITWSSDKDFDESSGSSLQMPTDESAVVLSSDEDFGELRDKDKTVELVCVICSVEAPTKIKQYDLFKFGLASGGSKRVMCLIWIKELIDKLQPKIIPNMILHIDGAHCKASKFPRLLEQSGFLPLEIIIQNSTIVNFLGMMSENSPAMPLPVPPKEVNFQTILGIEGQISIDGFIKTEFVAIPSRYQEATYGCGSITDGVFKITVNIANFQLLNLKKGTPVKVIGEVKFTDELINITCKDSNMISERKDVEPLTNNQLRQGNRIPKRKHE